MTMVNSVFDFKTTQTGSQHGNQAVFTLSLPWTGERSHQPGVLRVRAPAVWGYSQSSTIFTGVGNNVAFDIAEGLQSRFEVWERFFDRDRLHPEAVRRAMTGARFSGWR